MSALELVEKAQLTERPAMKSGDTVRVHVKVREGDKERIQVFEGVVIGIHRGGVTVACDLNPLSPALYAADAPQWYCAAEPGDSLFMIEQAFGLAGVSPK